jgi:hypothetical protein
MASRIKSQLDAPIYWRSYNCEEHFLPRFAYSFDHHNAGLTFSYRLRFDQPNFSLPSTFKGIAQPFETRLIRSTIIKWRQGFFSISMTQSQKKNLPGL